MELDCVEFELRPGEDASEQGPPPLSRNTECRCPPPGVVDLRVRSFEPESSKEEDVSGVEDEFVVPPRRFATEAESISGAADSELRMAAMLPPGDCSSNSTRLAIQNRIARFIHYCDIVEYAWTEKNETQNEMFHINEQCGTSCEQFQ